MLRDGVNSSGLAADWGKLSEEERKAKLGGQLGGAGLRRGPLSQSGELEMMARQQDRGGGGGRPHALFDQMFAQQRQFQAQDKAKAAAEEAKRKDELSRQEVDRFNAFIGAPNQTRMPAPGVSQEQAQRDFVTWLGQTGEGENMSPFNWMGVGADSDDLLYSGPAGVPPAGDRGLEGNVGPSGGNLEDKDRPFWGKDGRVWDTKAGDWWEKWGDEVKAALKVGGSIAFPPLAVPLASSAIRGYMKDQDPASRYGKDSWIASKYPGQYDKFYNQDALSKVKGDQSWADILYAVTGLYGMNPKDYAGTANYLFKNRELFGVQPKASGRG